MNISLCMIIKNEEKNLAKCLDKAKLYVDEIIIVDTGSTDKSRDIAKQYTDKVFDFAWCDDFAKARNFSVSKASNDWVLSLDADEIITEFDRGSIEKFTNNNRVIGRIKIINTFEDGSEIKKYIERINRFFNKNYFVYEGIIHEQIVSIDNKQYETQSIDIVINHIGYMNDEFAFNNKLERNIGLLKSAIEKEPQDPYLHYQLGKSYYKGKNYKKAEDSFSTAIKNSKTFIYEYDEDLIESYGYTLLKCEKYDEALSLSRFKEYYGKTPDYNFVMGLIFMNNARFKEAVDSFIACIGTKEGKIEGVNSFLPNYNIGVIFEVLGHEEEALKYYKLCGQYRLALERIENIAKHK